MAVLESLRCVADTLTALAFPIGIAGVPATSTVCIIVAEILASSTAVRGTGWTNTSAALATHPAHAYIAAGAAIVRRAGQISTDACAISLARRALAGTPLALHPAHASVSTRAAIA